jgi:hypothetical protein
VLEALGDFDHQCVVHRLAGERAVESLADSLGLTGTQRAEFIARVGAEELAKILLDDPFERRLTGRTPHGGPTRFSDGTFPVFYGAEARETSEEEIGYHFGDDARKDASKRKTKYMRTFRCSFSGKAADLRPMKSAWPWLTSTETCDADCLKLGKAAAEARRPDAFLAPSARHRDGTTLPIFQRGPLKNPVVYGTTVFDFDEGAGKAIWRRDD